MTVSYFDTQDSNFTGSDRNAFHVRTHPNHSRSDSLEMQIVSAEEWDALAGGFSDIIPEQTGSYNCGHWGEGNLEFVVFSSEAGPVGGAALIVKRIPVINSGFAILKWGPIFQKSGNNFDATMYAKIIDCLKTEYCTRRNFHLTIMPAAKPIISDECDSILVKAGFSRGEYLAAPERYLVNVQDDSETLRVNLDQKWRYNLKKAWKNDFDIRIVEPKEGLPIFLELYREMVDRKQFMDASAIGALENVMDKSTNELRPLIVLVSHEDKVTAGGVFHVRGEMASYMFGATDYRALKLKAGYALHWWVAEFLCKARDVSWYDLGGNDLDQGLHQFKKGFVGKSGHILMAPPRYHYAQSMLAKLVGFAAFKARDGLAGIKRALHQFRGK